MKETPHPQLSAEIERIRSLKVDALRALYRESFKRDAPDAFTKDLVARAITYRIQEKVFGGLDPALRKRLAQIARTSGQKNPPRLLKSGSVLLREYQGVRHTVTITDGGYLYREKKYASLTKIAREITGTAWNGPRFFGLRETKKNEQEAA